MRLVLATHNQKKAGEMAQILGLAFPDFEILTLADYPGAPEPEEDGVTYAANAAIKARSAGVFTGEMCVADDAGLEVDAMGGEPGIHSRRFAGEETPFSEKMAIILDRLQSVPDEGRGARFRCAVAVWVPETQGIEHFEASCDGQIAQKPSGAGGFGYDPIFWLPERGCTMADLTSEQKHEISHRGKVLRQLEAWLESRRASPEG